MSHSFAGGVDPVDVMYQDDHDYETVGRPPGTMERAGLVAYGVAHQAAFLAVFTAIGVGDELVQAVTPYGALSYAIGWCGVALIAMLYLLDAPLWSRCYAMLALAAGVVGLLLLLAGVVLAQATYPLLPLGAYTLAVPCSYYALRRSALADVVLHRYLRLAGAPLAIGGACTLVGWLVWVGATGTTLLSDELRAGYDVQGACPPGAANECLGGAARYFAPLASGLCNASFGAACVGLALRTAPRAGESGPAGSAGAGGAPKPRPRQKLHATARIFATCVVLIGAGIYVHTVIQGAAPGLATAALFFALAALVALSVVGANLVSWEALRARVQQLPLVKSIAGSIASSDWVKALMLMGAWAPLGAFFALSAAKQLVRACVFLRAGEDVFEHPSGRLTVRRGARLTPSAQDLWALLRAWAWTSVLTKGIWLGIVLVVLSVTSAAMPVFAAWLRVAVLSAGFPAWPWCSWWPWWASCSSCSRQCPAQASTTWPP